jgi:hypothetical protein
MISSSSVFTLLFITENDYFFAGCHIPSSDLILGVGLVLPFNLCFSSFLIFFLSGFSLGYVGSGSDIA